MYDPNNIFAKIIRKEIDCDFFLDRPHTLVFHDKAPKAPIHLLIIPKGFYISAEDFYQNASPDEILDFSHTVGKTLTHLSHNGFRLISNAGKDAGQEVPHFHMHLLAGTSLPSFIE